MKESFALSVCMITYNHSQYIDQAIKGVINQQTNFSFELIIGDDCSTDGTTEMCIEYQKKYPDIIRVIRRKRNIGIKPNLVDTLSRCRGKYIALCEGDDYWDSSIKLQKQFDFLEQNPSYVLIGGYAKKVYESENFRFTHDMPQYSKSFDFDISFLMKENPIYTLTACFKNGYISTFPSVYFEGTGGDRRLYILLCQFGRGRYMHEPLGVYRIHRGGITQKHKGNLKNRILGLEESIRNAEKWNSYFDFQYENEVKEVKRNLNPRLFKLYLRAGLWTKAFAIVPMIPGTQLSTKLKIVHFFLKIPHLLINATSKKGKNSRDS